MTQPDAKDGYQSILIPPLLGRRLQAVYGLADAPTSLGEILGAAGACALDALDLCCTEGSSRHIVRAGDETWHTHCVLDALLLPFLLGKTVEVSSASPLTGTAVTARVSEEGIATAFAEAVVSFGVAREGEGSIQALVCPYINAFPSQDEYERWTKATPQAITLALPLTEAFEAARDIARRSDSRVGAAAAANPQAVHTLTGGTPDTARQGRRAISTAASSTGCRPATRSARVLAMT